jgi:hypothetical protein
MNLTIFAASEDFRVFGGAHIRIFSAKAHKDLRGVEARLPHVSLLVETPSKP